MSREKQTLLISWDIRLILSPRIMVDQFERSIRPLCGVRRPDAPFYHPNLNLGGRERRQGQLQEPLLDCEDTASWF